MYHFISILFSSLLIVSRFLLLSDMILKLVHSSADPVLSANTVLTRLNGTLLQYNTKGYICPNCVFNVHH